jgi:hypothetical protein
LIKIRHLDQLASTGRCCPRFNGDGENSGLGLDEAAGAAGVADVVRRRRSRVAAD